MPFPMPPPQQPYAPMINAMHNDSRLDPVQGGMEPPIIQLLRKLRGIAPEQAPMHPPVMPHKAPHIGAGPKMAGLGAALKPKGIKGAKLPKVPSIKSKF